MSETPKQTPAEAARAAYNTPTARYIESYTHDQTVQLWERVATAAINAHLAQVAEGLRAGHHQLPR